VRFYIARLPGRDCGEGICHAKGAVRAPYPAHDEHPLEKVTVAVDPYDVEDKASIFSVNYRNNGYMPVFFVITNDGDQPVSLVT